MNVGKNRRKETWPANCYAQAAVRASSKAGAAWLGLPSSSSPPTACPSHFTFSEHICNNIPLKSMGSCTQTISGWNAFPPQSLQKPPPSSSSEHIFKRYPLHKTLWDKSGPRSAPSLILSWSSESTTGPCHCFHSVHCKVQSFCSWKAPRWNANSATFLLLMTSSKEHWSLPYRMTISHVVYLEAPANSKGSQFIKLYK